MDTYIAVVMFSLIRCKVSKVASELGPIHLERSINLEKSLFCAAANGHTSVVSLLLENGAKVNARNDVCLHDPFLLVLTNL